LFSVIADTVANDYDAFTMTRSAERAATKS
jgi:hypothetical protein